MKKFTKQLVAMAMAVTVLFSQSGVTAMANSVNDTSFKASGIEILSIEDFTEEVVEETSIVETTEVVAEETTVEETTEVVAEETTETVTEETVVEETTEAVTEETVVEETTEVVAEETIVEEVTEAVTEEAVVEETTETVTEEETVEEAYVFPGLPEGIALSKAQVADKSALAGELGNIKSYISGRNYVEGEVLVEADTREEADVYAEAFGGVVAEYNANRGIARILLPEGATVEQAVMASAQIATYSDGEKVLPAAWPNYLAYTCEEPVEKAAPASKISKYSDVYLAQQWHHEYMGSEYAWIEGYTGAGVSVAVIDTGILKTHEDLSKNTASGREFVDSYGNTDNNDYQGHGTHVAGIIAADGNNGKGGSGVAPDATVRSYRVFGAEGGAAIYDIINAVDAAVADGNDIINMSLGGQGYYEPYHAIIKDAINSGVAVFVAAGNESTGSKDVYPANFKEVCTIGALNLSGGAATFSNYGSHVDLAFPGVDIYSTYIASNSSYEYMDGTSMATPAAAGAAAVILSANPKALQGKSGKAKVDALVKLMQSSAKKSSSSGMGKGTTYIPTACGLAAEEKAPNAPVFDLAKGTYYESSVSVTITAEGGKDIYYSTNGKNPSFKNGVPVNATLYTGPVTVTGARNVTLKAIAVNRNGKVSKVTSAKYTLMPTPEFVDIYTKEGCEGELALIKQGKSQSFVVNILPSYAQCEKIKWEVSPANQGVTVNAKGVVKASKDAIPGTYNLTATATDKTGNPYDRWSFGTCSFKVVEDFAVGSMQFSQPVIEAVAGERVYISDYLILKDTAGNVISDAAYFYANTVTTSNKKVATRYDGTTGIAIDCHAPGTAKITVKAHDGSGKKATVTVKVTSPVEEITISGANTLAKGKSITLNSTIEPATAQNKKLDWAVRPVGQGVTVKNGKVTATASAKAGTYFVQATAKDGSNVVSNTYNVTVIDGVITSVKLPKNATIFTTASNSNAPTTYQVIPTIDGKNGFDPSQVKYTSSNPGIATVDASGKVTAKAVGTTKITVEATDGSKKKATMTINVNVPMSGIKIAPKGGATMYVGKGKSIDYGVLIYGEYGAPTNKNVVWSVADTSIAKVDKKGKVTGLAYGTTTLYAEAADGSGVKASYTIEIIKPASYFKLNTELWYAYDVIVFDTDSDIINKTAAYKVDISGNGCTVAYNYTDGIQLSYSKRGTYTVKVTLLDGSKKSASFKFRIL